MTREKTLSEGRLLFLIGAVQFVNILDFMMVMPLGPDFAKALDMPSSALGWVGGSYTAAAAVSGVLGATFLDRFDRRKALAVALLGLVLATAAGGFAVDLRTLLIARIAAGTFGGPATALALAIVADVVPAERRGRAMGAVMGAFSVASVLGVPAGLELARLGGWQLPFFAVAGLGAVIGVWALVSMPALTVHLHARAEPRAAAVHALAFLSNPTILLALASTALVTLSMFSLVPNISAYLQFNLGYPRERLGLLYLAGGAVSFVTMRLAGQLSDRFGPTLTSAIGNWLLVGVQYLAFVQPPRWLPIIFVFTFFMVTSSFRMVPQQALSSRVPSARERASFMSAQSAVQHLASAAGAMLSARLLESAPSGALVGIERVAWLAMAITAGIPLLVHRVQQRVERAGSVKPA